MMQMECLVSQVISDWFHVTDLDAGPPKPSRPTSIISLPLHYDRPSPRHHICGPRYQCLVPLAIPTRAHFGRGGRDGTGAGCAAIQANGEHAACSPSAPLKNGAD